MSTMTISYPQVTPGWVSAQESGANYQAYVRSGQNFEATSTLTDGFNGIRLLGVIINGVIFGASAAYANKAAWVAAVQTQMDALGLNATIAEVALTVTITSDVDLTLGVHNPNTPDLDLTAWVTAQNAEPIVYLRAGFGAEAYQSQGAANPTNTMVAGTFAGVVTAFSVPAEEVSEHYGLSAGEIPEGHPIRCVRRGVIAVAVEESEVIAAGDPLYVGTLPGEGGLFYPAQDGGVTRVQVPGRFLQDATGPANYAHGVMARLD